MKDDEFQSVPAHVYPGKVTVVVARLDEASGKIHWQRLVYEEEVFPKHMALVKVDVEEAMMKVMRRV